MLPLVSYALTSMDHLVTFRMQKSAQLPDVVVEFYFKTHRVAHIKIAHQTICNISTTSGRISKILEAA